ncbi:MAG: CusA/CzcA family heavy metal efflux RND transporter [Deltaproteobacteria bacterium HGW-Deltaproteobacteria-15]|jgi:Cu(I)/Ag(I) efflux system membrane protein CusA/SilA|nr:MAG: CusA/CzcA family heavy metal efflux RND transporter [Deltaproteobacteria bacterium HGW-Deltaproteobacteria-15]
MIARIIELCGRERLATILLAAILAGWGYWAIQHSSLDALPDQSDTQVIVYTDWLGRSPDLVEDQITYPISSTLLAAPQVKAVRGFSFLGSSFIYVIFNDGTDIYWARSRVLEYLQAVKGKIPADVNPVLGPDASGVGWGFCYALVDEKGDRDPSEMRSLQDYNVKLALESVPGVAQVASIGGFVKQYQIAVDPNRLLSYGIPINKVFEAIRKSNNDIEGRVIEFSGAEYVVRGRGYIRGINDLEVIPVGGDGSGTPVFLRDIAQVRLGPEFRRGIADLDGRGEVAGGIVVVRYGENVLNVIDRVKERIRDNIGPSLPEGVKIVTTYDRSDLIHQAVDTLRNEIILLFVVVSIICLVFLFHLPSALVVILTLPGAVLISFIFLYYLRVTSNIMSLSGIAISIGVLVDASIIMVENAHKRLEEAQSAGQSTVSRTEIVIGAAKEVGPSLFFALMVITVAFLPIFTLQGQEGRLFRPLAYAKTFAMLAASGLAITLTPALMTLFIRGRIRPEQENPVNRAMQRVYDPIVRISLRFPKMVVAGAVVLMAITAYPIFKLGSESMPALYEGALFYMPVTAPGVSISEASSLLQKQDRIIKSFPEVSQVFGKAGRAETATDPAPLEMFETVINLKPKSEWREGMTVEKLVMEMNDALALTGVVNSFTSPIKARIDMLSTGIRTPMGMKIFGPDIKEIEKIGIELERRLKEVVHTRSVYAERVNTGYFLDIAIKREKAARYNLTIDDVNEIIQSSVGGLNVTTTIEGRGRYPVNIRYARELRSDVDSLKRVLLPISFTEAQSDLLPVASPGTAHVPLSQLADIRIVSGATQIKSEAGMLTGYVYIDCGATDAGTYIREAKKRLASFKVPDGYRIEWSGDYERIQSIRRHLKTVIPLTILLILILIYTSTRSYVKTAVVLLSFPFALAGAFWLLYLLGYHMSTAVWVGMIALAGLDAETDVVMLLYLDLSHNRWKEEGKLNTLSDLQDAVRHGAVKRVRPKIMTLGTTLIGLVPILFSTGIGSEIMKSIAAPMIGGLVTSTVLELAIYPAIYMLWKKRSMAKDMELSRLSAP